MDRLQNRLRLKAHLRKVRSSQPFRTSDEAYAQMDRMQVSASGTSSNTSGVYSTSGLAVLV